MKNHLMIANTVLAAQALAGACVISCAAISIRGGSMDRFHLCPVP